MNIRKIIRESLEQLIDNELTKIDGFNFVNKKTDKNGNLILKFSKKINVETSSKKDSDYTFNIFIAQTPNKNWYYKVFVYWKKHTKDHTSGKGKDFELQLGPFNSFKDMKKDLDYNIKHNTLFSAKNYEDNNKSQLNDEVYKMISKVKNVYEKLLSCKNTYFDDLKKEMVHLSKEKPEVDLYISKNYPDEDDKQQLLLILSKIDSLNNLKEIEAIKSIF